MAAQWRPGDVASVAAAGLVFVAPRILGLSPATPAPCGPCDPLTLPGYDRWALAPYRPGWSAASWIVGAVAVGLPVLDLWNEGPAGRAHAAAVVQAASWAVAASELIKVGVGRARPALYQAGVTGAEVNDADNRQSFPSAHTAGAVAAVTTYWLARGDLPGRRGPVWVAWGIALGAGVMRITAGKHFPSDVLGGIVTGAGTAALIRWIRD